MSDESVSRHLAAPPAAAAAGERAPYTVLCVDDEPNILSALRRLLRGTGYKVLTAGSGAEALALLQQEPVDLVLSDMRMPGMDGAQLLEEVRTAWPETVRLLLTGYADVGSTVAAINRGEVYRYITKPWNEGEILMVLSQALERHALALEKHRLELLTQEQNQALQQLNASLEVKVRERTQELAEANEHLKRNYLTSIKAFSNLIELRGGTLVGHSRRVADLARRTARAMNCEGDDLQQIFVAGLLHDIGQIGMSDLQLATPVPRLPGPDGQLYRRHPVLGEQALIALDDLQPAAALIRSHHERHDGEGFPDRLAGEAIPLGARILAVADVYDNLQLGKLGTKLSAEEARLMITRGRGTQFHPEVVDVFLQVLIEAMPQAQQPPLQLASKDLRPGMALAHELVSRDGMVLLAKGHVLTADLIARIRRHELRDEVTLQLLIQAPRRTP